MPESAELVVSSPAKSLLVLRSAVGLERECIPTSMLHSFSEEPRSGVEAWSGTIEGRYDAGDGGRSHWILLTSSCLANIVDRESLHQQVATDAACSRIKKSAGNDGRSKRWSLGS